jgi:hypothetical protein
MREAQELERLRLPFATRLASFGGVPSELDQPRFVRMQVQAESREPLAEIGEEPLGVLTMLKARQKVVSLCRVSCYAERLSGSLVVAGVGC